MPEIRVNADATQVAIRREGLVPDDHPLAWGVMTFDNGGMLTDAKWVDGWTVVPAAAAAPLAGPAGA